MIRAFLSVLSTCLLFQGFVFCQRDGVLYLMGEVVMEDSTPVPKEFRVELVCDSKVVRQSFANETGVFHFDLGTRRETQTVTDAGASPTPGGINEGFARSAWNPPGFEVVRDRVYLESCHIRLGPNPGYVGTEIKLGIRGLRDSPDVGKLFVRRAGTEAATLDASLPPEAAAAFQKALAELSKEKPDHKKAQKSLEEALKIHPEFAQAWTVLGELHLEAGKPKEARQALLKAVELEAMSAIPYVELAQLALEDQNWQEASEMSEQALSRQPDSPKGLLCSGLADYYLEQYGESYQSLARLEELGQATAFPISLLHLGMLYAKMGEVPSSAERLQLYLEVEEPSRLSAERRSSIERQLQDWQARGLIPAEK